MSFAVEQDTPIVRAKLSELTSTQIEDFVSKLQERRLKAQAIYQEAQEAKKELKDKKDADLLAKRLEQFEKKAETVDNGLKTLEKYAKEILGIRLALGL